ncbi:MAG: glycosyltransferase family 2 protein [Bacteroidota bacterium]|nr:glycosyltransferase family 2 protein [Bacteroidota bacterium]
MNSLPQVSFVIPLYNEDENFEALVSRLNPILDLLEVPCEVVMVDDGSRDQTPVLMNNLALIDARYQAVFLSRNHGHQLALSAGLKMATATEAVMVLDGDLQDPPEVVIEMLAKLREGFEVVYGVRKNRKEPWFKKMAYFFFYRLMKLFARIDLPVDSGDFALMSRKVVDYLNTMPEQNRYLRGMRAWIGFKQTGIPYQRSGRHAGSTKYSFRKLLELAYSGVFNFSDFPIKFITRLGLSAIVVSLLYLVYVLISKFAYGNVPTGFTALLMAIVMFSGVQLISLGIIGEYVLRIYQQSQKRPLYIIDKVIKNKTLLNGQELLP